MKAGIGHKNVLNFFENAFSNNAVSHAYCFAGPKHVGKTAIARILSARILLTEPEHLERNPDFLFVERGTDEKKGTMLKNISVDQVRNMARFVFERPFLPHGRKAVIVSGAEHMSESAAHCLLKTLEEPGPDTTVFLLVADHSRLLPTIRSRCQTIKFQRVPHEELAAYAREAGVPDSKAKKMAELSCGLPGRVVTWSRDNEAYERHVREVERFDALAGKPFYEKRKAIEDIFGDKSDHIAAREELMEIVDIWHGRIHAYIHESKHSETGKRISPDALIALHNTLTRAQDMLGCNIHPRLLIEQALLALA